MPFQTALGNVGITKSAILSPAPSTARAEVREVCKSRVALAKIVLSEITADSMLRQALLSTSLSAPDKSSGDKAKPLEQDPDHLLGDCTAKKCISGPRRVPGLPADRSQWEMCLSAGRSLGQGGTGWIPSRASPWRGLGSPGEMLRLFP